MVLVSGAVLLLTLRSSKERSLTWGSLFANCRCRIRVHITGSIYLMLVAASAPMGWTQSENELTIAHLQTAVKPDEDVPPPLILNATLPEIRPLAEIPPTIVS